MGQPSQHGCHSATSAPGQQRGPDPLLPFPLLSLPDAPLCHVLRQLDAASDLLRCATACKALHATVTTHPWPRVTSLRGCAWGPGVSLGLLQAVCGGMFPQLVDVDLGGMSAGGWAELEAVKKLGGRLKRLSLRDWWRFPVCDP